MLLLGIPTIILAILLGLVFPYWRPVGHFIVPLAVWLTYNAIYCLFFNRLGTSEAPPRGSWQFMVSVVCIQIAVLSVVLYTLAA